MSAVYAYAAIGSDGMRPVVWGLGDTPEAAEADAYEEAASSGAHIDPELIDTVPVTAEQVRRVREGEVDAVDLGLWALVSSSARKSVQS